MTLKEKVQQLEERVDALERALEFPEAGVTYENNGWVEINNENCPTLKKYGAKPFRIMRRKFRDADGDVVNNINFIDAQKKAKSLGHRLPDIREMLALLEHYRNTQRNISCYDKSFLGIEELSYDEQVNFEWVDAAGCPAVRGGNCYISSDAGVFALRVVVGATDQYNGVGFRCASDPVEI